jgi:hypothetical protein
LKKPALLLVTSTGSPTAARLALALVQQGCRVDVLCPTGHPVQQVPGLGRCWHFAMLDSLGSLHAVLGSGQGYRMILPCDDAVVAQLIALHEQVPVLRSLIEQSIGAASCHPTLLQRHHLLTTAQSLGLNVPEHRPLDSAQDLLFWFREGHGRSVLQRDLSFDGAGACVVSDLSEAERVWPAFSGPLSGAALLRRLAVERDPLAWWSRRHPGRTRVLVQRFIEGQPANTLVLCEQGRVLAWLSLAVVETQGSAGPAAVVRRIHHPGMEAAARRLAAHLPLTGLHSLDFMLEPGSDRAWLTGLNPHCTPSAHLAWADQPSLAAVLAARLRGHAPLAVRQPLRQDLVSLFPQVPQGQAQGEHDVPGGHPALVQALADKPWPQQRWTYRLLAWLRPPKPVSRVRYDDVLAQVPLTPTSPDPSNAPPLEGG